MTRLTADPPLIQFDTFEMLEKHHFTTYSLRTNLKTSVYAEFFNISELDKLHEEHGSVLTHEVLPIVSELWYLLMTWLRPFDRQLYSMIFLKDGISYQMWKYINNSAMLPDYGQGYDENISTVLDIHMKWCNKSAIILRRKQAITLHTVLKHMGKPSFFGKDKILEKFWGYKFLGYFPSNIIFRARYLFETGVFEWWQKFAEFTLVLKTKLHVENLVPKAYNRNGTSESEGGKIAVVILSLIPGVGLLISLTVFIFAETPIIIVLQKHVLVVLTSCSITAKRLFLAFRRLGFKSNAQVEKHISIYVQPKS